MDAEASQLLRALRSFVLNLPERVAPKEGVVSRAEVVRPLVAAASEALVWSRGTKEPTSRWGDRHVEFPAEIVVRERGRWRMDLTREVYTGYGPLWYGSDRGSIALRLPRLPADIGEIFSRCCKLPHSSAVGILASRYQLLKADSAAAVRYCDRAIDGGEYALLFPPGASLISLFAPHDELVRLYRLANERCPMHGGRRKLYHGPPGDGG